jgi:RND family efflux transporter MFP subunit
MKGTLMETISKLNTVLLNLKNNPLIEKAEKSRLFARFGRKTWWLILAVVVLVVFGITYYQIKAAAASVASTETLQTSVARKGDLTIYASGSGSLTALDQVDLGFKTSGQVSQINMSVGDVVKAGDVLAVIDDNSAQVQYTQAKRTLLELTSSSAVAAAEEAIAAAETEVNTSISQLAYLISPEVYYWETEVEKANMELEAAKTALKESPDNAELQAALEKKEAYLDFAEDKLQGNWYFYDHEYLRNIFTTWDKSSNTKYINAPTDADIKEARAALSQAKASLLEAQYLHTALTGGEVPEDATGSGLSELEQAKLDLETAQVNLDGTKITAPISGTVMSIDMSIGDTLGTTAVITVADLSQQYLEVFLDESDWTNVQIGYKAEVTFDILPDSIFVGEVIQVDPGLYTENNSSVVRAVVKLTDEDETRFNLPLGTSAAVDIIGGEAEDAILIPLEALHETTPGEYAVFVMESGEPRLHPVKIGIQDITYVEIKSGVEQGDIVTTGIAETQ